MIQTVYTDLTPHLFLFIANWSRVQLRLTRGLFLNCSENIHLPPPWLCVTGSEHHLSLSLYSIFSVSQWMSISDSNLVDSNYFMHTAIIALTAIIQYDETKISLSQLNAILSRQKNAKICEIFQLSRTPSLVLGLVFSKWVKVSMLEYFPTYRLMGFYKNFAPI